MASKKPPKGSQTKVESITVRLHPKIKYGLELLARKQHRTLSSVVEWALDGALKEEESGFNGSYKDPLTGNSSYYLLDILWDIDEVTRFIKLAWSGQLQLISYEEELIWETIKDNAWYWRCTGKSVKGREPLMLEWDTKELSAVLINRVKDDWALLLKIASGELTRKEFRNDFWFESKSNGIYSCKNPNYKPSPPAYTDEDIPF